MQPTKRNWLAEIQTKVDARPNAVLFYGPPGAGKTSFAAAIPGVVFLMDGKEQGLLTLKANHQIPESVPNLPPIWSFDELLDAVEWLRTGEHSFRAAALDTLGGFERFAHQKVCDAKYHGEWSAKGPQGEGFESFGKGAKVAVADWLMLLTSLDRLRDERKMSVVLLAHARAGNFKNPMGPDYQLWTPDCDNATWGVTHKWCDLVIFANHVSMVDEKKKKESGVGERVMYTTRQPGFEAKNRHGLPEEIGMGKSGKEAWANFVAALKTGREAGKASETQ